MFKRKSIFTVKQATMQAFQAMPETFSLLNLVNLARSYMGRPMCSDESITRRLRELRHDYPKIYGYTVIDYENSKYKKGLLKEVLK